MNLARRRRLRVLQASPLIVIALSAAMLLTVPSPLASQMFSMARRGIAIYDPERLEDDRLEVASAFYRREARRQASAEWADVRFPPAARRTWQRMSLAAEDDPDLFSRPGAIAARSPEFQPMREFVEDFPGTRVDIYYVAQPALPPLDTQYAVAPHLLPAAGELASLEATSVYAFMWRAVQGNGYPRFDPEAWKPMRASKPESVGAYTVRAVTDVRGGKVYRALILQGDNRSQPKARVERIHDGFPPRLPDTSVCVGCHEDHAAIGDGGGWGTAIWYTGEVELRAVPQYGTRSGGLRALTSAELVDILGGKRPATHSSVVWTEADEDDRFDHRPTMLFVARFPKDPRADFDARQAAWPTRFATGLRVSTAVALPWLSLLAGLLLVVTSGVSLHALSLERRLLADERADAALARVQRDAHDRVYNRLSALAKQVEALEGEDDTPARLAEDVRGVVTSLQTILGDAGRAGAPAETVGLPKLLATVAAAQASRHGVSVDFAADEHVPSVPAKLGWDLQCVLEEAINNAVGHGSATHIDAVLRAHDRRLILTVTDNGGDAGEPTEESAVDAGAMGTASPIPAASTGLAGMRARLAVWNGHAGLGRAAAGSVLTATAELPGRASKRRSRGL